MQHVQALLSEHPLTLPEPSTQQRSPSIPQCVPSLTPPTLPCLHHLAASCTSTPPPSPYRPQPYYDSSTGFWSLVVYDKNLDLVPNPINR